MNSDLSRSILATRQVDFNRRLKSIDQLNRKLLRPKRVRNNEIQRLITVFQIWRTIPRCDNRIRNNNDS